MVRIEKARVQASSTLTVCWSMEPEKADGSGSNVFFSRPRIQQTSLETGSRQSGNVLLTLFQQFCYIFFNITSLIKMAHLPAFNYLLIASLMYLTARSAHANPGAYGHHKVYNPSYTGSQPYLPALPGKRPSCAGPSDTFCTKIDYYPTEVIEYLVKRYSFDFKTLLQDEAENSVSPFMSTISSATNNTTSASQQSVLIRQPYNGPYVDNNDQWWTRYGRLPSRRQKSNSRMTRQIANDEKLCPTISSFITPRAAVNTKGTWMYVVNLEGADQQSTQLVRTERCATTECSGLCQVPAGFTSTCSQEYVQKRLVALNGNGESLYTDTFWFPHCCICQIRSRV